MWLVLVQGPNDLTKSLCISLLSRELNLSFFEVDQHPEEDRKHYTSKVIVEENWIPCMAGSCNCHAWPTVEEVIAVVAADPGGGKVTGSS